MKQLPLVLSSLALVGVVYLLINDFSAPSMSGSAEPENAAADTAVRLTTPADGYKLAYINTDTLVAHYNYHKGLKEQLQKKAQRAEADLARKQKTFEDNYMVLEQEAKNLSQEQLQYAQMELGQKQQELLAFRDQQMKILAEEEQKLTLLLMEDLEAVLVQIKEEEGLDFIFSEGSGSSLLGANPDHDITMAVVARLNAQHAKRK